MTRDEDSPMGDSVAPTAKALFLSSLKRWWPFITAIIAGLWVAFVFFDQQTAKHRADLQLAAREERTQRIAAQKPFLDRQLSTYFEAARLLGQITTTSMTDQNWDQLVQKYWIFEMSELMLVEDADIVKAIARVHETLATFQKNKDNESAIRFRVAYIYAAQDMQKSLVKSWSGEFGLLKD